MSKALTGFVFLMAAGGAFADTGFVEDMFPAAPLDLGITFIGHGTLIVRYGPTVIHVDPVSQYADYKKLPKADIVLVTHEHSDHLDARAIEAVRTPSTIVVVSRSAAGKVPGSIALANGETQTVKGIAIEAVSAYNIVNMRAANSPYHPKGDGNGYVLALGQRRLYVAGDSENTPEMKALKAIDIAFLPMNLPYTMTPEMVADAALAFRPRILYPYHYGNTDTAKLTALLASAKDIEVRIRELK